MSLKSEENCRSNCKLVHEERPVPLGIGPDPFLEIIDSPLDLVRCELHIFFLDVLIAVFPVWIAISRIHIGVHSTLLLIISWVPSALLIVAILILRPLLLSRSLVILTFLVVAVLILIHRPLLLSISLVISKEVLITSHVLRFLEPGFWDHFAVRFFRTGAIGSSYVCFDLRFVSLVGTLFLLLKIVFRLLLLFGLLLHFFCNRPLIDLFSDWALQVFILFEFLYLLDFGLF